MCVFAEVIKKCLSFSSLTIAYPKSWSAGTRSECYSWTQ